MRRRRSLLAAAGALVLLAAMLAPVAAPAYATMPRQAGQATTPIKHVIVLVQEGHSFDNYFGTYPGADGISSETCMPIDPTDARATSCVKPFRLGDRPVERLDSNATTFARQRNGGKMDGFVYALRRRAQNGALAMGYYDGDDIPLYWNIADNYVLFDRFFSSTPNDGISSRMYMVSGELGPSKNHIPTSGLDQRTVFDQLTERGISWKFYVQNYNPALTYRTVEQFGNSAQVARVPLLAFDRFIDDPALSGRIVDLEQFYEDLRNDTLPSVVYISSSTASEQAPSNIRSGPMLVRAMLNALMQSKAWDSSAFVITYDGWGGWYDHVDPPSVDEHGYGFRVPTMLVSPYARQGYIDHTTLDHASILKFIQENYGLPPLTTRAAKAASLTSAFDFAQPPRQARIISTERDVVPAPEPRRDVIYICYSAILIMAGAVFAWAIMSSGTRPGAQLAAQPGATQDPL
jgi:phospholipase C